MAMTAAVKDELSRISVTKPCCRKAEVSSLLRFAGVLAVRNDNGNVIVWYPYRTYLELVIRFWRATSANQAFVLEH